MTRLGFHSTWCALLITALAMGCSDSFESADLGVRVGAIAELPVPTEMTRNQVIESAVTVKDRDDAEVQGVTVAWHSSDELVVRVSPTKSPLHAAQLTAVGLGQAEITVSVTDGIGSVPDSVLVDTVSVHEGWTSVSVGRDFTCGTNVDSVAYCWDYQLDPAKVPGLSDFRARNIEVGHNSACAVVLEDTAMCWGLNSQGELGTNDVLERPVAVPGFLGVPAAALLQRVYAGGTYFCAKVFYAAEFDAPDEIFCYGNSTYEQLGQPPDTETCNFAFNNLPCGASLFTPLIADSMSAGENHMCAIESTDLGINMTPGPVSCWGAASTGQLGPRAATELQQCPAHNDVVPCGLPRMVDQTLQFVSVSAGWDIFYGGTNFGSFNPPPWLSEGHTCAITDHGVLYCWGKNNHGQLGAPSDSICVRAASTFEVELPPEVDCRAKPMPVNAPLPGEFKSVTTGSEHTCGIMTDDQVYCWGSNEQGQLGDGTTASRMAPAAISGQIHFASVSSGPDQTCGVTMSDGIIYCWGAGIGASPTRLGDPR
jgi:alpha-tubulin suppressor-like RCC1 family protein